VRVHSENLLSDLFQGKGLPGHQMLKKALAAVAREGRGVMLYMQSPNPGETLLRTIEGKLADGPPMSFRDYGIGAQILVALGLGQIRLLSNSARRVVGLDGYGLEIVEQVAL
jgi:3,4-dihydroxy 2-butanone 4-phosphate synthase/GTP cyclohydrolase II